VVGYPWAPTSTSGGIVFAPTGKKAISSKNDGSAGQTVGFVNDWFGGRDESLTWNSDGSWTFNTAANLAGGGTLTSPVLSGTVTGTYTLGGTASLPTITGNTAWLAGHPVIPSSTLAGLGAAGTAGRLARVTDNVRGIWIDNGTIWVKLLPFVHVGDFGTDIAAVNAALQAAHDNGYDEVRFEDRTYTVNTGETLTMTARNVSLVGYGTIIQAGANNVVLATWLPDNVQQNYPARVEGIRFDGNSKTGVKFSMKGGIGAVGGLSNVTLKNVFFHQVAVEVIRAFSLWFNEVIMQQSNGGSPLLTLGDATYGVNHFFYRGTIHQNDTGGVLIKSVANWGFNIVFEDTDIEFNTGYGATNENGAGTYFRNVYFEGNTTGDIINSGVAYMDGGTLIAASGSGGLQLTAGKLSVEKAKLTVGAGTLLVQTGGVLHWRNNDLSIPVSQVFKLRGDVTQKGQLPLNTRYLGKGLTQNAFLGGVFTRLDTNYESKWTCTTAGSLSVNSAFSGEWYDNEPVYVAIRARGSSITWELSISGAAGKVPPFTVMTSIAIDDATNYKWYIASIPTNLAPTGAVTVAELIGTMAVGQVLEVREMFVLSARYSGLKDSGGVGWMSDIAVP
jgi:hypothetical protein